MNDSPVILFFEGKKLLNHEFLREPEFQILSLMLNFLKILGL